MTEHDWPEFCRLFDDSCRDFRFPPGRDDRERQRKRFFQLLRKFHIEIVKAAFFTAGSIHTNFPSASELLKIIEANPPKSSRESEPPKARIGPRAREVNGRFLRALGECLAGDPAHRKVKFHYFNDEVLPGLMRERRAAELDDQGRPVSDPEPVDVYQADTVRADRQEPQLWQ